MDKGRYMYVRGLIRRAAAIAATILTSLLFSAQAPAADPSATQLSASFTPGDMALTGFSGTLLAGGSLKPGVDPVDKTIIDLEGPALRVFDLSTLAAPTGQNLSPVVKFEALAKDVGQVSGLAFDDGKDGAAPNLYAAATSAFGLQIVAGEPDAGGQPVRLKAGAPGAHFMDGQFSSLPGASPGAIWRIDGTTGVVSLLADTTVKGVANSGPGLGALAFDPKSHNLYASDLDTGLIHRFALDSNCDRSQPIRPRSCGASRARACAGSGRRKACRCHEPRLQGGRSGDLGIHPARAARARAHCP